MCNSMWHSQGYQQGVDVKFPVLSVSNLENTIIDDNLMENNVLLRFKEARNRDHMMVPFQCNVCHFKNL